MFRLRRFLQDMKQELEERDGLSSSYTRREGKVVVETMIRFQSSYLKTVFDPRVEELNMQFQQMVNKARFQNYLVLYNALRCKCEQEYDLFMNVILWKEILENFCDRTHSQYGIVAIVRAAMVTVNKEIWKAFFEKRAFHLEKESSKRKRKEMEQDIVLKQKQLSAKDQCINLIEQEFSKKWKALPSNVKTMFVGASKEDTKLPPKKFFGTKSPSGKKEVGYSFQESYECFRVL